MSNCIFCSLFSVHPNLLKNLKVKMQRSKCQLSHKYTWTSGAYPLHPTCALPQQGPGSQDAVHHEFAPLDGILQGIKMFKLSGGRRTMNNYNRPTWGTRTSKGAIFFMSAASRNRSSEWSNDGLYKVCEKLFLHLAMDLALKTLGNGPKHFLWDIKIKNV